MYHLLVYIDTHGNRTTIPTPNAATAERWARIMQGLGYNAWTEQP